MLNFPAFAEALLHTVQVKVNDRRDVQRQELAEKQAANNCKSERLTRIRAFAVLHRDRQRAE